MMNKSLISYTLMFSAAVFAAQGADAPVAHVVEVSPTQWDKTIITHDAGGSGATRGGVGAAAGWWLLGPLGAIAGAAIGAGTTDPAKDTSTTVVVHGFYVKLSDGQMFKTEHTYKKGDTFNFGDVVN